jgi:ABC-type polysaccharide/polyol phosphate transport system ATPase subunit
MISCAQVSKRFRIPQHEHHTLRGRILHPRTRPTYRDYEALSDVSFDVAPGEFFGIVGRNGSGKSTLLKIIAGIYRPDNGSVHINGSLASFIELGVGFNAELSGRDNLLINGALLGLSRKEILHRFDSIVEFAELDGFMDLKLRNFSSGMQVRLAFSIALQADVDVLLTDEVLAVGDARFQEKCYEVFRERKAAGRTIVFVSHDMSSVQQFCDRALLIDDGVQVDLGDTYRIARRYLQLNQAPGPDASEALVLDTTAAPAATIQKAWVENSEGQHAQEFGHAESIRVMVRLRATEDIDDLAVGLTVQDGYGQFVFMTNSALSGHALESLRAGDEAVTSFEFPNYLANGMYTVGCGLARVLDDGSTGPIFDMKYDAWHFRSVTTMPTSGMVDLPTSVTSRRVASTEAIP